MEEMVVLLHESCGLFGYKKTSQRLQEKFYLPGMSRDIKDGVNSCEKCIARKKPHQKHKHPLQTWKPSHPFWPIALNFMGPLPESEAFKYFLLIGDQVSK